MCVLHTYSPTSQDGVFDLKVKVKVIQAVDIFGYIFFYSKSGRRKYLQILLLMPFKGREDCEFKTPPGTPKENINKIEQ